MLTPEDTQQLLYRVLSTEQQKQLEIKRQIDTSHAVPGLARFRVNVYFQREALGAAFRVIPEELKTLEELNLPRSLAELAMQPRGLVLVTGPTGSGKSTTLAAMIDEVNRNRTDHILTIEDPIEFVHTGTSAASSTSARSGSTRRASARPCGPRSARTRCDPRRRDAATSRRSGRR